MKKLILFIAILFISCSTDEVIVGQVVEQTCYPIVSRGFDNRGNFIIVQFGNFNNKRYKVDNYQDYINVNQICDLSNLIEQTQ